MAQESTAESGKSLARDMRRVRESRRLTVEDLHDETKIPLGLLQAFEETALFDHPQFNRVYLRSFVRTYANVLNIDPEVAIEALEEALSNRYSGSLAVEYLGEEAGTSQKEGGGDKVPVADVPQSGERDADERAEPDETSVSGEQPTAGKEAGVGPGEPPSKGGTPTGKEGPPPAAVPEDADEEFEPSTAGRKTRSGEEPPAEKEEPPAEKDKEQSSTTFVSTTGETAAGYERSQTDAADESEWSTQSPPTPKPRSASRRSARRSRPGDGNWRWIAGVAAVIIVGIVVWIVVSVSGNGTPEAQETTSMADTAATADTAAVQETADAARPPMPVLGDTMNVHIIAANDKADPIRVTVDDDLRRPYWIELGDSMTFRPINRIVIEEDLDDIELSIEGAAYPASRRDENGRIVITRDSLRAYFGSNGAE